MYEDYCADYWEEYCAICGAPISDYFGDARNEKVHWLADSRIKGFSGIVKYDNCGWFKKNDKIVAQTVHADGDYPIIKLAVHDVCFKLNGKKIPNTRYKSGLEKYQSEEHYDDYGVDRCTFEDPRTNSKNRARILKILGKTSKSRNGSKNASSKTSKKASSKTSKKGSRDMTVVELKALCKQKGISGFSTLKKDQLIRKCNAKASKKGSLKASKSASRKGSRDMTVAELKALCKQKGISGYNLLKKDQLIRKCNAKRASRKGSIKKTNADMTVVQLRALCKKKGVRGYSGKNKAQLIKLCNK